MPGIYHPRIRLRPNSETNKHEAPLKKTKLTVYASRDFAREIWMNLGPNRPKFNINITAAKELVSKLTQAIEAARNTEVCEVCGKARS